MKAMILAAGLGTRLKPLTDQTPKALVKVYDVPLLEIQIRRLIYFGYDEIIINVHHFKNQVESFLAKKNNFGISIKISDESDELLETGGGLMKAAWLLTGKDPFLLINVDVLTNLDLNNLYKNHLQSNSLATLAVLNRTSSRYLLFNDSNTLCGWRDDNTNREIISRKANGGYTRLAFSGIHMINPEIFSLITETGKFSIITSYLNLAQEHIINGCRHDDTFWLDAGKPEAFNKLEANDDLRIPIFEHIK